MPYPALCANRAAAPTSPMRLALLAPALSALVLALAACSTPPAAPKPVAPPLAASQALALAERSLAEGRLEPAAGWLAHAASLPDADAQRVAGLRQRLALARQEAQLLDDARNQLRQGQAAAARRTLAELLAQAPRHPAALALQRQLDAAAASASPPLPPALAAAYARPVSIEFREAPLRQVLEALARGTALNIVFDKDVRGDAKVTLFLRDTPLDEALRVLLGTQQLQRSLLNANTLLIYPDTSAKRREYQELETRTLYLTNADAKGAAAALRAILKVQDLVTDERLNALVLRDTPAVVRAAEDLLATIDLPEPEVVIDVEVLEVASNRLDELGLQWPETVELGLPARDGGSAPTRIALNRDTRLTASIANPGLVATLRGNDGRNNTLARPTIRARSREKAQVHVGDKLPVFTTTSTANVGVSASVSYLDVGIKLDVEPTVLLDNDVSLKVGLEVSNLVAKVSGPAGSVAYQVGTRRTSSTLRLRDGETQVLAGLINDEDRRGAVGVPGLSTLPVLGRLFGVHSDTRNQTEVVLLLTPRVLRNLPLPPAALTRRAGGTAADPGAAPLRLSAAAQVAQPLAGAARAATPGAVAAAPAAPSVPSAPATPGAAVLQVDTSASAQVGDTVTITLHNASTARISGELEFDAALLANAAAGGDDNGRLPFALAPGADFVAVLRVLPAAQGRSIAIGASTAAAVAADGSTPPVELQGRQEIEVRDGR